MNNPITQSTDETCNIVQDLLPLYYDDVCSPSSKRLVEKHLKTCEKCQNTYNELKNDSIDSMIKKEADSVLKQHEKKEKSAAYKTGVIIAGLLLIPILITFIVCLSNGGGLNTFAVVTASMLLVAAMTVVPLMAQQKKLTKCIICGVFALLLIFFFVDRMYSSNEFMLWSVPTIFGLSIILFPFVIRGIELPPALSDKKALITMLWDTLWLFLTIIEVCGHTNDVAGMKAGCIIAFVFVLAAWLIFFDARYLNANGFIKSAIIVLIASFWTAFADDICEFLIFGTRQITIKSVNFSDWTSNICVNANVYAIVLVSGVIIASILFVAGGIKAFANKNKLVFSLYIITKPLPQTSICGRGFYSHYSISAYRLANTLCKHSVNYFLKACDICTCNIVSLSTNCCIVSLSSITDVSVDCLHNALELSVNLFECP